MLGFPFRRGVNLLDENVPLDQRDLLRARGVHCRIIGQDIAQSSIGDDNILALLPRLKRPTFFTRDEHFSNAGFAILPMAWCFWTSRRKKPRCLFAAFSGIHVLQRRRAKWGL